MVGAFSRVTLNGVKGLAEANTEVKCGRDRLYVIKKAVAIQATERLLVIYETIPPFSQKCENTPFTTYGQG